MNGKEIRLNRLLKNNKMLSVPLDHGFTNGAIGSLGDFQQLVVDVVGNGATAIVVHKGMVRHLPLLKQTGLIVHLSASTDLCNEVNKILVCSVEEALRNGADAVSVHVNIGNSYEKSMLKDLADISKQCDYFQIPLLAMMYVRDDSNFDSTELHKVIHAVRIASELGADIVKIPHMDNMGDLKKIVNTAQIPVIIAGGEKYSDESALYKKTENIMKQGVMGVSFGRNVFEYTNPGLMVKKLETIIMNK